jgi:uncharacterized protein YyaL (SSP411 family)
MSGSSDRPANRLAQETSLYLRQHAHNPIDWYPWGPEALGRARQLDRPIFLSVGYSACHWCHVMAHESFEDDAVARLLNEHFVSIKLDREERPDLDAVYMAAVQALNQGQGGWPMSVFLTPDLQPFFAGTYFPPDDRYGRPGFKRVLRSVVDAWHQRRDALLRSADQITAHIRAHGTLDAPEEPGEPTADLLRDAAKLLRRAFDFTYGGFGQAPKFPHVSELRLLLRCWQRFDAEDALVMVRLTLEKMARGGIYDQVGGGFHRYSVDERWLVPHFEKMLYDNAQLAVLYTEAFQATGDPEYRRVVGEVLDYVLREMTSPHGGFYSTQDADSEGEEGKFTVWTPAEVRAILGDRLGKLFCDIYDITPEGNFEGKNIPNRSRTDEQEARLLGVPVEELRASLAEARRKLYDARAGRVWPGRDEKLLTSWNGLMIDAFARAGAALDEPRYTDAARRAADFVLGKLRRPDGRLFRTCGDDAPAKLEAFLEDHAFLADALVSVYEATFEPRYLRAAEELAATMVEQFGDAEGGGFFFTARDHERLIARNKDYHDGSTPSGSSMAVQALLRLAALTGRADFRAKAADTLRLFRGLMEQSPSAVGQMLVALDFYLGPVRELAIVGDPAADDTRAVLRAARGRFAPRQVVALRHLDAPDDGVPLLRDRPAGPAGVRLYVCQGFSCQSPSDGAEAALAALGK